MNASFANSAAADATSGQSVIRAPPLVGLYGKPVPLNSGEVVIADEGYLRDSILLPAEQIAGGYTDDMPSFKGKIAKKISSSDCLSEVLAPTVTGETVTIPRCPKPIVGNPRAPVRSRSYLEEGGHDLAPGF